MRHPLSFRAMRVLGLFRRWTQLGNLIQPKRRWLAKWLLCSVRTVQTVLNELYSGGFIGRQKRYRKSNIFKLCTALCTAVVKPQGVVVERRQSSSFLDGFRDSHSDREENARKKRNAWIWDMPDEEWERRAW